MSDQKNLAKNSWQFTTPGDLGADLDINTCIQEGHYDWFLDALDDAYERRKIKQKEKEDE